MIRYVDTGFWIAVALSRDEHHAEARRILQTLTPSDQLVTSEFVLVEFLNYFSERGTLSRKHALSYIRQFESDPMVRVIPLSSEMYQRGLKRFERSHDKGWSLTDCTSFLIMEDMDIQHALAFDDHFEQAGFISDGE
jgi:predicted nucleic acid-binding protein